MKKILLLAAIVALVATAATWFIGYDSVCGFSQSCNSGVNPTTNYGFPLTVHTESLYGDVTFSAINLLLNFAIIFACSFAIVWCANLIIKKISSSK